MQSSLSRPPNTMAPEFGNGQPANDRYNHIFQFFGLRENPFNISPNPRYLSFARQTQEAFDAITYGIQTRQGLLLLTGEVGTGKTTLTNYLRDWLYQQQTPTSFIFNSRLSVDDLFDFVLADFGITCESKQKDQKRALLTEWLLTCHRAGKTPILIVDEAQGLLSAVLEEIRLLLDLEASREKLLQVVLVGQPELEEKLGRPELRPLRERVMVRCKIGPLNSAETPGYIQRRLHLAGAQDESVFLPDAMDALHSYSCGIPRVINILCEHALINAYADQIRPVSSQIVKEVAQQFQFDKIGPLHARPNFDKARSKRAIATRSISTLVRVPSAEAAKSASTAQRNRLTNDAPVPAVDKNVAATARPVTNRAGTADTSIAEPVAARRRWMPGAPFFPSLSAWRRWRDKSVVMLRSPIFHHAASWVVRWLQQPARPVRVCRRVDQGAAPGYLRRKVTFARVQRVIQKGSARLWHDAKARFES